jgi:RNA-directed DNA polymerase
VTPAYAQLCAWPSLWQAWRRASGGRRGRPSTAGFAWGLADHLLALQHHLQTGAWAPAPYTRFVIHEPKRRVISAAAFADRVVHHALCAVIEPRFERVFIADSYANRLGKGTHRAIARCQALARAHPYALRMDVRQHFPSLDHALLLAALARQVPEADVMALIERIVASGTTPADEAPEPQWFVGDDLLAPARPQGLPIGNLTSQCWSNVFMHGLDLFVLRSLRCRAYLRYVDDFALFSHSKAELWAWRSAIIERLAQMRLRAHESQAQVARSVDGIPWLGMQVFPDRLRLKARKLTQTRHRLGAAYGELLDGGISFAEFDARVQSWLAHAARADPHGGLRERVMAPYLWPAGASR